jgi:hypothetical protein
MIARRPECPRWCACNHSGIDPEETVSHFSQEMQTAGGTINVCAGLITHGHTGPEVIIDRYHTSGELRTIVFMSPTWVRLSPSQAVNLAALLEGAGVPELPVLIRQAADTITGIPAVPA